MIQIEIYDKEKHYAMLERWWHLHNFPPVPAKFLPKLGAIAYEGDQARAAGWVYLDNSCPVAKLEWVTTNPALSPFAGARALNVVVDFLKRHAFELGYAYMMTTAHHSGLIKALERLGFVETDLEMTHLAIILDPKIQADYLLSVGRGDPVHPETILGQASS